MNYYATIRTLVGIGYYMADPEDRTIGYRVPGNREVIEIILSGYGRCHTPGGPNQRGIRKNTRKAGPGTILRHTEGDWTLTDPDPVDPYRCMHFHFERNRSTTLPLPHAARWENLTECSAFCWEVFSTYHHEPEKSDLIGLYVYGRILWEMDKGARQQAYDRLPLPLQKMMKALSDKPSHHWTVPALGAVAGISESHVYLLFKRHAKTSPHEYLSLNRLNQAKTMLITSSLTIKEIGTRCGFNDTSHFTRLFRQRVGMPPGAYRQKFSTP